MRHAWHVFISVLLWCLFGYYWYVVVHRQLTVDSGVALLILAAIVVAGCVLTVLWVVHNKRLATRLGRRKGFAPPPEDFACDHLGRPVVAPPLAELRAATAVVVELDGDGRKTYRVAAEGEI